MNMEDWFDTLFWIVYLQSDTYGSFYRFFAAGFGFGVCFLLSGSLIFLVLGAEWEIRGERVYIFVCFWESNLETILNKKEKTQILLQILMGLIWSHLWLLIDWNNTAALFMHKNHGVMREIDFKDIVSAINLFLRDSLLPVFFLGMSGMSDIQRLLFLLYMCYKDGSFTSSYDSLWGFFLLETEDEKIFWMEIHRYSISNTSANTDAYINPKDGRNTTVLTEKFYRNSSGANQG